MGTVRMENHYYPPGQTFTMPALGEVINFQDVEVSMTQVAEYTAMGFVWPDDDHLVIVVAEPELPTDESVPADTLTPQMMDAGAASLQMYNDIVANSENPRMSDAGGRISGNTEEVNLPYNVPVAPVESGTPVAVETDIPSEPAPEPTITTGGES